MSVQIEENLRTIESTLLTADLDWQEWCEKIHHPLDARYSLVQKNGTILCDTSPEKKGKMIQDLTEIKESFKKGFASHTRFSDQYNTQAVFGSLKLTGDVAIRKVVPISTLKDYLNQFDRVIYLRIVPLVILSWIVFLIVFYHFTKPLGSILNKVEQFKVDIPFNRSLKLLYKQDEWAHIEEALNEADSQLKNQINQVKDENEKITTILESISDKIIAIDPFETVLFYNQNFKRNFMQERAFQELIPKIWHTFKDEKVLKAFQSVLKDGQSISLKGINFQDSLKADRYFDLTITSLKNAHGKIIGALGVFHDVTEFKLTEQMRVDFVANVSHEIRTPLTSIKGYTQVLEGQKNKIDPDLHLFLEKIISNTERMISLFNDLLSLSVIEAKNLLKMEELSLNGIIEEISENIRTNYPHKQVTIEHDLKLETIKGDQRLMEQVLSNLIDNSCKYSGDLLNIKISTFRKDNKGYIVVADNGPGISKEHLQRIFERFYRVDASRESSRGTGLGLSIVKHIIAKHNGHIWAESEESHGTNFIIELPLS